MKINEDCSCGKAERVHNTDMTTKQIHQENRRLNKMEAALQDSYAEVFGKVNKGSNEVNELCALRKKILSVKNRITANWNLHL